MNNIDTSQHYFVSFIDLLGFSGMVKSDLEAPLGTEKFVSKLYRVHKNTLSLNKAELDIELVQFSDSVVLATKFDTGIFGKFLDIISRYQSALFFEGILARGGIAYGKHFYQDGFMYSLGLIEAYNIESKIARFPRIVISDDLFSLIYPERHPNEDIPVLKENDGQYFLDYLRYGKLEDIKSVMKSTTLNSEPSVREKQMWLIDYFNKKFPDSMSISPRFCEL